MENIGEFQRQRILDNLSVGINKPLGYLPFKTVEKILAMNVAELVDSLEKRGVKTKSFSEDDCCIGGGALYAYDPIALQRVLDADIETLKCSNWPTLADLFVEQVAKVWVEPTDPAYTLIQRAFGDS